MSSQELLHLQERELRPAPFLHACNACIYLFPHKVGVGVERGSCTHSPLKGMGWGELKGGGKGARLPIRGAERRNGAIARGKSAETKKCAGRGDDLRRRSAGEGDGNGKRWGE